VKGVTLPNDAYARLLGLRTGLRHFERWSEQQAQAAGLTPAQHQLLLAIRGHGDPRGPTIGEVADYLLLVHHSVVGLIDRAETASLVTRTRDQEDHRVVRLHLTADGAERLEALSALHIEELKRLAPQLPGAWEGLAPVQRPHGLVGSSPPPLEPTKVRRAKLGIARVYDHVGQDPRRGVLVDRLWPRGLARSEAPFTTWAKEVAPTPALRKWYGHKEERFDEFAHRYLVELASSPAHEALEELQTRAKQTKTVLLTATKDLEHSHAAVLQNVLASG
jgi:uncharacterized protein YeaO (DUF488 family)/DNA-binding MarR family transcriptional regulator